MNYFLFEKHVVFVLFGTKPMSEIILYPSKDKETEQKLFASLPKELQSQAKIVKYPYSIYECWNTWKRNQDLIAIQDFLVVERPLKFDPSAVAVFVVNIKETANILCKHYNYFKSLYGNDFDPKTEIYTLKKVDSAFWDRILEDHFSQGLLFGFGEKNSRCFAEAIRKKKDLKNVKFSYEKKIDHFNASKQNFSIPLFRSFEDEEIIRLYKRQQKEIKKIYRRGDTLEITLKKLTERKQHCS